MLGSLAVATELSPLAFFDFNSDLLTAGTSQTSINLTVNEVTVTVSTSYSGGLGSGTSSLDFQSGLHGLTELNSNVGFTSEDGFTLANSRTYLSAGARSGNADLTVKLSGLEAGSLYNVSFVSGLDFEGSGAWTTPSTTNTYESCNMGLGTQCVPVRYLGAFDVVGMTADDEGCITFTLDSTGSHTAVINSMAVALQNVPEPATASLSLLALGALALRRRRG